MNFTSILTGISACKGGPVGYAALVIVVGALIAYVAYPFLYERFLWWRKTPIKASLTIGVTATLFQEAISDDIEKSFRGYIKDVLSALGRRMGSSVSIVDVSAEDAEAQITSGALDAAILDGTTASTVKVTTELVPCYLSSLNSLALVFLDKMPHHIISLHDYALYPDNATAVIKDSLEEFYLSKFEAIKARPVESMTTAVVDLKLGIVRAILVRMSMARELRRDYPNVRVAPVTLQKRSFLQDERLALSRSKKALVREFEQAIAALRRDGGLKKIHSRWFK